jgi:hypothetical protein
MDEDDICRTSGSLRCHFVPFRTHALNRIGLVGDDSKGMKRRNGTA